VRHRIRTRRFERSGGERSVEVWPSESEFGIRARRHRSDSAPASTRPPNILVNQVPSRRRYCEVRLDRAARIFERIQNALRCATSSRSGAF